MIKTKKAFKRAAMRNGELSLSLRIPEESTAVRLLLNDRWFNPSDIVARHFSMYESLLSRRSLGIKDQCRLVKILI